jgi:hypothetical protein
MDDDDKVRRNLMVVSFAVLLYFWLELPDSLIVKRLLGEDYPHALPAWKIWLTLIFVQGYQLHRFISANMLTPAWEQVTKEFRNRRVLRLHARIQKAEAHLCTGALPRWFSYNEPLAYGRADFSSTLRDISDQERAELRFRGGFDTPRGDDPFFFRIAVLRRSGEPWKNHDAIYLHVPARWRWTIDLQVLTGMCRSAYFSEFGVPMLMGYSAFLLSVSAATRAVMS